jgi:hypothetical protein
MDMRSRSPEWADIFVEIYKYDYNRLVKVEQLAEFQPHIIKDAIESLNNAIYLLVSCPNHIENKQKAAKSVGNAKYALSRLLKEIGEINK